jgi:hypothetical protein
MEFDTEKFVISAIAVVVVCFLLTVKSCTVNINEQRVKCYENAKSDVQSLLCSHING